MAIKAISELKEAENKAKALLDDAKKSAAEILKSGNLQVQKERDRIVEDAKAEAKMLAEKAKEKGEEEAKPIREKGDTETSKILNLSPAVKEKAVEFLKERILEDGNH